MSLDAPDTGQEGEADDRPIFADERRRLILEIVNARGRVRVRELADLVGVTEPTIRKDVTDLDGQRLLRRTHGGAIAIRPAYEPSVSARVETNARGKRAIARACLAEIREGDAVFLDSGTTMIALAEALRSGAPAPGEPAFPPRPANVNVLTNALEVARLLAPVPGIRHTVLGGQYRMAGDCLVGPLAVDALQRFTLNIAFIGVSGFAETGFTVADVNDAQVKIAVMERARRVIVPMDHTKIGAADFIKVCDPDRIDTVVTDEDNPHLRQMCDEHGVHLVVAG
ncbi:MAG: DeoR/GlpR family DNA-binding transcription regulator [Acidimicrobiales bacterium]